MQPENPYSPPVAEDKAIVQAQFDLRPILRRWEQLRIAFNVILAGAVLLCTVLIYPHYFSVFEYWTTLVAGAVVANICFTLGPAVESYLQWFQVWHISLSIATFIVGTMIALGLAIYTISHPTTGFIWI